MDQLGQGSHRALKNIAMYFLRGVTLLLASTIVAFFLTSIGPHDDPIRSYIQANPGVSKENVAKMEEYWGLNEPPASRYLKWLNNILHGDMGYSTSNRRPVAEVIGVRFKASIALMMMAWLFSGVLGFGIGCVMGRFNGKPIDRLLKRVCLVMCSIPTFWIGIVFLVFFSVTLGWFPFGLSMPIGADPANVSVLQRIHHLILPALTVSFLSFAQLALHTREKLVEVMESDFVLFAKARGENHIVRRHGIRNILIPAVTMQFSSFSELFGGSVIAENIFSYPGLGNALTARIIRGEVLQIRSKQYVKASRKFGKSKLWIAIHHILPHMVPQFFVGLILQFPHAIMHESGLTFLGYGMPPETPAIGIILSESMRYLSAGMWWLAFFPGLALVVVVLLIDKLGESLKLVLDPSSAQE